MSRAKVQQRAADRKQLEQEIHLVKAPGALAKEKEQKLKGECCLALGAASGCIGCRIGWRVGVVVPSRGSGTHVVRVCLLPAFPPDPPFVSSRPLPPLLQSPWRRPRRRCRSDARRVLPLLRGLEPPRVKRGSAACAALLALRVCAAPPPPPVDPTCHPVSPPPLRPSTAAAISFVLLAPLCSHCFVCSLSCRSVTPFLRHSLLLPPRLPFAGSATKVPPHCSAWSGLLRRRSCYAHTQVSSKPNSRGGRGLGAGRGGGAVQGGGQVWRERTPVGGAWAWASKA